MTRFLKTLFDQHPRQVFILTFVTCVALLAYGMYLQHGLGLEPCPMCVVQRYGFVLIGLVALVASVSHPQTPRFTVGDYVAAVLIVVFAGLGAFTAARQSWLQWYPPEIVSCGRDIYGMVENFPLQRAIPMIFKGSGDCTKVDWTFLGGSIANWSFVCFVGVMAGFVVLMVRQKRLS